MTNETWIVYKTESMDATGWENPQLMSGTSLTDILHEEWDSSGVLPQVGEIAFGSMPKWNQKQAAASLMDVMATGLSPVSTNSHPLIPTSELLYVIALISL